MSRVTESKPIEAPMPLLALVVTPPAMLNRYRPSWACTIVLAATVSVGLPEASWPKVPGSAVILDGQLREGGDGVAVVRQYRQWFHDVLVSHVQVGPGSDLCQGGVVDADIGKDAGEAEILGVGPGDQGGKVEDGGFRVDVEVVGVQIDAGVDGRLGVVGIGDEDDGHAGRPVRARDTPTRSLRFPRLGGDFLVAFLETRQLHAAAQVHRRVRVGGQHEDALRAGAVGRVGVLVDLSAWPIEALLV